MSEEGVTVPAFYRTLGGTGGPKEFDGSREAWLWKQLMDERDEECIETAARIIEVYKDMGSYPQTGEDFHQLADFMASLRCCRGTASRSWRSAWPATAPKYNGACARYMRKGNVNQ